MWTTNVTFTFSTGMGSWKRLFPWSTGSYWKQPCLTLRGISGMPSVSGTWKKLFWWRISVFQLALYLPYKLLWTWFNATIFSHVVRLVAYRDCIDGKKESKTYCESLVLNSSSNKIVGSLSLISPFQPICSQVYRKYKNEN